MNTSKYFSEDPDIGYCGNCGREVVGDNLMPFDDIFLCEHCYDKINRKMEMINLRNIEKEGFYDFED